MSRRDLADAAEPFVAQLTTVLTDLGTSASTKPDTLRHDVTVEAANLAAAIIDADGRTTDDECWAYVEAFGVQLDGLAGATPAQLRDTALFTGKRAWLGQPSTMFDLLVAADSRDGQRRSHTYYRLAMKLAHTVASLDLVPSPSELAALEDLRRLMLQAMDAAAIPRPGAPENSPRPAPSPSPSQSPKATATNAPAPTPPEPAPLPPARPLDELLAELDALVGLAEVKADVRMVANLLQVAKLRRERDLPIIDTSNHLVFTGNPGTGKTTVARLVAQIYRTLGVVSRGQLIETDRSKLVAGFVGQTAIRTREAVESAIGGMLLVDEAYALARGSEADFGKEAIDTLVKLMEDHRDDLAVVAAGYPDEMQTFIDANPGLRSRFTRTLHFPDYTDDELVKIFCAMGDKNRYRPNGAAIDKLRDVLAAQPRDKGFGNARFVRNLFEHAVSRQASRLITVTNPTEAQLTTLEADDLGA